MKPKAKARANDRLFKQANAAWDRGDLRRAFELFLRAAEAGDDGSQLDLGYFYDCGLHVKTDKRQAMQWYHRCYRQGVASAANNIAILHRESGDTTKMVWWFRRAVAMGEAESLLDLGKCYEAGTGVARNPQRARQCYRRLISSENVIEACRDEATERLGKLMQR